MVHSQRPHWRCRCQAGVASLGMASAWKIWRAGVRVALCATVTVVLLLVSIMPVWLLSPAGSWESPGTPSASVPAKPRAHGGPLAVTQLNTISKPLARQLQYT